MWRPNEPTREEISNVPGMDPQSKRRRSRRRAWRDGLADQTVVKTLEDVRYYRAFERALIGSVDPRSALELALVHRLGSLLWRLRRASALETALFETRANFCSQASGTRPTDSVNLERSEPSLRPIVIAKAPAQTDETIRRPASKSRCQHSSHHRRSPAPSPNVSCASAILTRPCLTA
jgi:hypothetical protein